MILRNSGLDLVNSEHIRGPNHVDDDFENTAWVEKFLKRWALPQPLTARERNRLRELRALLRAIVDELSVRGTISDGNIALMQSYLPSAVMRTRLQRDAEGGFRLVLEQEGQRSASAEVARSFAELIAGDGCRRIKACDNEHCRWAFYDESRNRSRRWCDSTACGNVMKARAFRKRKEGEG